MSFRDLGLETLEQLLNHCLTLDPQAKQAMAQLQGRIIEIEFTGLGQRLYLIPGPTRLQLLGSSEEQPDCSLRGTPMALARLADPKQGPQQMFRGEVQIEGDTQLAHQFSKILGDLEIDWEEQLSRLTGDAIAHQGAQWLRQLSRWGAESRDTLRQDLQEYLQQEQQVLATREQLEQFCEEVDRLRDDLERLQARLQRLQPRNNN